MPISNAIFQEYLAFKSEAEHLEELVGNQPDSQHLAPQDIDLFSNRIATLHNRQRATYNRWLLAVKSGV